MTVEIITGPAHFRLRTSRHGIIPPRMEGLAFEEPHDGQPDTPQTMAFDGLGGIDRAGRLEAARRRHEGRDEPLPDPSRPRHHPPNPSRTGLRLITHRNHHPKARDKTSRKDRQERKGRRTDSKKPTTLLPGKNLRHESHWRSRRPTVGSWPTLHPSDTEPYGSTGLRPGVGSAFEVERWALGVERSVYSPSIPSTPQSSLIRDGRTQGSAPTADS